MRGGLLRSICFLAFLLSSGINGENAVNDHNQHDKTTNAEERIGKVEESRIDQPVSKSDQIQVDTQEDSQQVLSKTDDIEDLETRSSASAVANAASGSSGPRRLHNPYYPNSAVSSASAVANSGVNSYGPPPYHPSGGAGARPGSPYNNLLGWRSAEPESDSEESDERASSDIDNLTELLENQSRHSGPGQLTSESLTKEENSDDPEPSLKSASELEEEDDDITGRRSYAVARAFASAVSRVVSQDEYILPHNHPGGESSVVCSKENQLLNVWSPVYQCLLCVCVREGWRLKPVCISCSTCQKPHSPSEIIIPTPPPPVPEPQASCAPLPTEVPFQNPLNPCQICICRRSINVFGQPDVQIRCEENPQCAPIPVPKPVPNITPEPTPVPVPTPTPKPMPVPQPDIEPIPWPPIVPKRPLPPSPLPGPPPHESCRPYPPNHPFQHPWDECQICVCSEFYGNNIINIEVNCFTKRSCCVEPPIPEPLPLPPPYPGQVPQIVVDQICELRTLDVQFPHPRDICKICVCEQFGNMIIPVCRPTNDPGCNFVPGNMPSNNVIYIEPKCRHRNPYETFTINCQMCTCQEVFHYVVAKCNPLPNCGLPSYYPQIGNADASAQAIAQANALGSQSLADASASANAQLQGLSQTIYPHPLQPGPYGQSSSSAQAQANAGLLPQSLPANYGSVQPLYGSSSSAEANANAQSTNYNPYSPGSQSSAQAQAEAIANAQSSGLLLNPSYPGSSIQFENQPLPGLLNSQTSAQAEAVANSASNVQLPLNNYPYSPISGNIQPYNTYQVIPGDNIGLNPYNPLAYGVEQSNTQALANAQAQANAEFQANAQVLANAQAQANAEFQANAQALANTISQANAQAQANAQSQANAGQANAQALANALAQGGSSNAQAQAEASANSQSNLYGIHGSYPYSSGGGSGHLTSNLQPNVYTLPNSYGTGLYQPGGQRLEGSALAQAQALAQSQGLEFSQALAQSLAQASTNAQNLSPFSAGPLRPLIKSAPVEDDNDDDVSNSSEE